MNRLLAEKDRPQADVWWSGEFAQTIDLADKGVGGGNNIYGSAQALTLGLNWFLNPNMKLQWNYTYEMRYGINPLPPPLPPGMTAQNSNGELRGFGMRMAIDW